MSSMNTTTNRSKYGLKIDPGEERTLADDVESVAAAPAQGTPPVEPQSSANNQGEGAKQAFFTMMNEWVAQYARTNPAVQQFPNLNNPPQEPVMPSGTDRSLSINPLKNRTREYLVPVLRKDMFLDLAFKILLLYRITLW